MSAEKEAASVDLCTRVIVECTGFGGRLPRPESHEYHPVRAMSHVREGIGSDTATRHPDPTEFGGVQSNGGYYRRPYWAISQRMIRGEPPRDLSASCEEEEAPHCN